MPSRQDLINRAIRLAQEEAPPRRTAAYSGDKPRSKPARAAIERLAAECEGRPAAPRREGED
jgi:hypothetical protein